MASPDEILGHHSHCPLPNSSQPQKTVLVLNNNQNLSHRLNPRHHSPQYTKSKSLKATTLSSDTTIIRMQNNNETQNK